MRTIKLWVLLLACGLAGFEASAGGVPISNLGLLADNADEAKPEALGIFEQSNEWTVPKEPFDALSGSWASLQHVRSFESADNHRSGVAPRPSGREAGDEPTGGSSFILIGLGGGILICLGWRMAHASKGPNQSQEMEPNKS